MVYSPPAPDEEKKKRYENSATPVRSLDQRPESLERMTGNRSTVRCRRNLMGVRRALVGVVAHRRTARRASQRLRSPAQRKRWRRPGTERRRRPVVFSIAPVGIAERSGAEGAAAAGTHPEQEDGLSSKVSTCSSLFLFLSFRVSSFLI